MRCVAMLVGVGLVASLGAQSRVVLFSPGISQGDLVTTCLTLERLTSVAINANDLNAVATYTHAYDLVRKKVTDATTLKGADAYMAEVVTKNPVAIESIHGLEPSLQLPGGKGGGFTHTPKGDLGALFSDPSGSANGGR